MCHPVYVISAEFALQIIIIFIHRSHGRYKITKMYKKRKKKKKEKNMHTQQSNNYYAEKNIY